MKSILAALAQQLVPIAIVAVGAFIARTIKKPTDQQKAELLARIANDAAALAVIQSKGAPAAQLIDKVVRDITLAAGLPVTNHEAIRRAAAAALKAQGVS